MAAFKNFLHTAFSPPYLLYTSTGVSAVIELIGDYLEQKVERVSPYDTGRGIRMTTTAVVAGPPYYFWYRMLDKRLPGRTSKIIFKKVLLDQTILSPIMIVAFYVGKEDTTLYHYCCVRVYHVMFTMQGCVGWKERTTSSLCVNSKTNSGLPIRYVCKCLFDFGRVVW